MCRQLSTPGIDYLIRSLKELVHDYNEYATVDKDSPETTINPEIMGVVITMIQITSGEPISAELVVCMVRDNFSERF